MLAWQQGAPTLSLLDPHGQRVDPALDPGITYTEVVTNAYYVVNEPISGTWQMEVGNLSGDEYYALNVLGSNVPPSVTVQSVTPHGSPGDAAQYAIQWTASDPDDEPTLALYYDTDMSGADGTLIAQGIDPAVGSAVWDASAVATGDYALYARIDDLKNAPVVSYFTDTVTVVDGQPPGAPTGLEAQAPPPWTAIRACWDRNPEPDAVGYHVYYGRQPGTYGLGRIDATNRTCASLPTQAGVDTYYVAVAAYDSSGNEGPLSEEREVTVLRLRDVYLPLVLRAG
jgi:hypothetical protein